MTSVPSLVALITDYWFEIWAIITMVTFWWILIKAFRQSIWWGVGLFFIPILVFVFAMKHWTTARRPFLIFVTAIFLGFITPILRAENFFTERLKEGFSSSIANYGDALELELLIEMPLRFVDAADNTANAEQLTVEVARLKPYLEADFPEARGACLNSLALRLLQRQDFKERDDSIFTNIYMQATARCPSLKVEQGERLCDSIGKKLLDERPRIISQLHE